MSGDAMDRIRAGCRELHHTYAINWTTAILALGMALFVQLLGIAVQHEFQRGALTFNQFEALYTALVVAQVVIVLFWLSLCFLAWLGPEKEVTA